MCDGVSIRKFIYDDIPLKVKWINDSANNKYLHYDLPLEYEKTCEWFRNNAHRTDRYDATIEVDGVAVGLIGLLSIDMNNKKAEYYISMGETSYKGRGVATKASIELFKYAFDVLGLERLYLFTEVENIVAQKLFLKIGFQEEGLLRNDLFSRGQFVDRYAYAILRKDYDELYAVNRNR